jgi:Zn-finger nucleic acid-binding protein
MKNDMSDFEKCPKCNTEVEAEFDEEKGMEILWCPSCKWEEE